MVALIIAALIIGIMASTKAGRAAARQRQRKWNPMFWGATAFIWAALLFPWDKLTH
jgi:hypothetical protein